MSVRMNVRGRSQMCTGRYVCSEAMTIVSFKSQVWTYVVSAHVAFRQSEELVAVGTCLNDFFEGEVHVCVALDQVAVEGFAVLELDEHGVALGGCEEAEGELRLR